MRCMLRDNSGVSNVVGYLFSFTIASILMVSSFTVTNSILDDKTRNVAVIQARSIADKVADAIIDAVTVTQSMPDAEYTKIIDMPRDFAGFIGRRQYYVEVTGSKVFVNSTDGSISENSSNFNAGEFGVGLAGRVYSGSGKLQVSYDPSDYVYKFDFGTGNSVDYSPVKRGYYQVSEHTLLNPDGRDPPWIYPNHSYRLPILINNTGPGDAEGNITSENLTGYPVRIVLDQSFFDYSKCQVVRRSSEDFLSGLVFYDASAWKHQPYSGRVLYVDSEVSPPGDGSFDNPFSSLSDALNPAESGDIIYVFDGTYDELLTVTTDGVHIIGQSRQRVQLTDILEIQADNVTISSLTFQNVVGTGLRIGRNVHSYNVTVANCDFRSNAGHGVFLGDDSGYCSIINCNFSDHVEDDTRGIHIEGSSNNIIDSCYLNTNYGGIYLLGDSHHNILRDCIILNGVGENGGIYLMEDNSDNFAPHNNSILRCRIANMDFGRGIMFHDETTKGLCDNNIVRECIISNTASHGVEFNYAETEGFYNNQIYWNNFVDVNEDRCNGCDCDDRSAIDKTNNTWDNGYPSGGNYWDDYLDYYSGDSDGDGIGDEPYRVDCREPAGSQSFDHYPFIEPLNLNRTGLPYSIIDWNPSGESVIHVLVDIPRNSSKYIYLYYGFNGTIDQNVHYRSLEDTSLFYEGFNDALSNVTWGLSDDAISTHMQGDPEWLGNGCLYLTDGQYILANMSFSDPTPDYWKTADWISKENGYIVEARLNLRTGHGNIIMFGDWFDYVFNSPRSFDFSYFVSSGVFGTTSEEYMFWGHIGSDTGGVMDASVELDNATVPDLDYWVIARSYLSINNSLKHTGGGHNYYWFRNVTIDSYLYDAETRAYLGHVSYSHSHYTPLCWLERDSTVSNFRSLLTNNSVGVGAGLIVDGGSNDNISIDWIRVLKSSGLIEPKVSYGSPETHHYGFYVQKENPSYSGAFTRSNDTGFNESNPYQPDKINRDYIIPDSEALFVISDLTPGTYTFTLTSGNASGSTPSSTVNVFSTRNRFTINNENVIQVTIPGTNEKRFKKTSFVFSIPETDNGCALQIPGDSRLAYTSLTIEWGGHRGIQVSEVGEILDVDIPIENIVPSADANGPYTGNPGDTINFDGSNSYDIDGSITSYYWDLNESDGIEDGDCLEGITPSKTYAEVGEYVVTLTVTDDDGAVSRDNTTVTISEPPVDQNWWDDNWDYRKLITINAEKVSNYHTNFPILIYTSSDDNLSDNAQIDGDDIVFTDNLTNPSVLAYEIEFYDSSNGELAAWVNIPQLSSTVDTNIWMYYRNSKDPDCSQEDKTHVWNSHYTAVWHHNESDSSPTITDSTSNRNHGTPNKPNAYTNIQGVVANGSDFDTTYYLDCGQNPSLIFTEGGKDEPFTIEAWLDFSEIPDQHILGRWNSGKSIREYLLSTTSTGQLNLTVFDEKKGDSIIITSNGPIVNTGNYQYIVATFDPNAKSHSAKLYVDASQLAATQTTGGKYVGMQSTESFFSVGCSLNDITPFKPYSGSMDEVRISDVSRDSWWIQTTYNTIRDPNNFLSFGTEEELQSG